MSAKNHSNHSEETRLALLEQSVGHIYELLNRIENKIDKFDEKLDKLNTKVDRNFYSLLTLYIGGYAAILGIMAKGFHWI